MSASRIGFSPGAGRGLGASGIQHSAAGISAQAALPSAPPSTVQLSQIHWASTWPRGWMAAAVPQHVREFNAQISKAQMALAFLESLSAALMQLDKAAQRQRKLPSAAGKTRLLQALKALQSLWSQRYSATAASVDECLVWSPTQRARKVFALAGWSSHTLQAQSVNDQELLSFSLMGQDHAHGAWMAQHGRSSAASRHALAVALASLQIQIHSMEPLQLTVDERLWPMLQERFVVKGNGQRLPAGQWVAAPLQANPESIQPATWSADTDAAQQLLGRHLANALPRVQQTLDQVRQFCEAASHSVDSDGAARLVQMQQFAQAFAAAGQAPAYDWVMAVVPAVRAISRRRAARLLKNSATLDAAILL